MTTPRPANRNYAFTQALVASLAELGLRHVCLCPGSRNTPLAVAFAQHRDAQGRGIDRTVHHDERSAAFFALGLARATRQPVAVVTTSGTAAAELHPAAVEARFGRVPLLLLTADRPPELRDVGAPQAVDQVHLFGDDVAWHHDAAPPDPTVDLGAYAASLAGRAWAAAMGPPSAAVHLNLPFRDPLAPDPEPGVELPLTLPRPRVAFHPGQLEPSEATVRAVRDTLGERRTLVVVGPLDADEDTADAIVGFARAIGAPVLADPLSGLRSARPDDDPILAHGDTLARIGLLDDRSPAAVVRFGAAPTSKAFTMWAAANRHLPHVVVDDGGWRAPDLGATTLVQADPAAAARAFAKLDLANDPAFTERWLAADRAVDGTLAALAEELAGGEPGVVRALADALPDGVHLVVGSSMPIRDVDTFLGRPAQRVRILANRGANGIDGTISTAAGAALEGPTVALLGDLAFLHDVGALSTVARLGLPLTIFVVDNDGGGIFRHLPQAAHGDWFDELLVAPHGRNLVAIASGFGLPARRVRPQEVADVVAAPSSGPSVFVVKTDGPTDVALHRRFWEAAREAVSSR